MADEELRFPADECPPKCRYRMVAQSGDDRRHYHCGYILHHDNGSRGCEIGPGCIRYSSGEPVKPKAMAVMDSRPRRRRRGGGMKPTWDTHEGYRMHREGATSREIAETVGIAMRTVQSYRQRYWNRGLIGPGIQAGRDSNG